MSQKFILRIRWLSGMEWALCWVRTHKNQFKYIYNLFDVAATDGQKYVRLGCEDLAGTGVEREIFNIKKYIIVVCNGNAFLARTHSIMKNTRKWIYAYAFKLLEIHSEDLLIQKPRILGSKSYYSGITTGLYTYLMKSGKYLFVLECQVATD